jgi:hypothetical protein
MANIERCTNRKKCILCHWKLMKLPLHGNSLSPKMTHFRLCQVFLLLVSTTNLTKTKYQTCL